MRKNNSPKNERTNKVPRQRDPIPWRYCFLTVICGLILVTGFFFAARQHFSAIEYGIKNSKMRDQKVELENVQRQLYLAKEIALSPTEIKKSAKKIGLQEFASKEMEVVRGKAENLASSVKKIVEQKVTQAVAAKFSMTGQEKPAAAKESKEGRENKSGALIEADNIRARIVGK